jgi:GntR family transcriptional regulator
VRYGLTPATTTETIEVVSASPREAEWLDIAHRKPLLAITRVTRDGSDRPFEYAYDLFRADRVRLTSHRERARLLVDTPMLAGI